MYWPTNSVLLGYGWLQAQLTSGLNLEFSFSLFLGSAFSAFAPFSHSVCFILTQRSLFWSQMAATHDTQPVRRSDFLLRSPSSLTISDWIIHPSLGDSLWPRWISNLNWLGSGYALFLEFEVVFPLRWPPSISPLAHCIYGTYFNIIQYRKNNRM